MDRATQSNVAVADATDPHHAHKPHTAHSLREAAESENPVEGYAAMNIPANQVDQHAEIAHLAYSYFLERGGEHGRADEDWHRAEAEIRRRNQGLGISES